MVTSGTRSLWSKCEDYSSVRFSICWAEGKLTSWIDVSLIEGTLHFLDQNLAHLFTGRHMSEIAKSRSKFELASSCRGWIVTQLALTTGTRCA